MTQECLSLYSPQGKDISDISVVTLECPDVRQMTLQTAAYDGEMSYITTLILKAMVNQQ